MKTQSPIQTDETHPPEPSLWRTLKSFPRPVWIVFLGVFINRFGTFVVPFLALHMTRMGYSIKEAGYALIAYGGGHLMASLIGGHLADTIGRRNTIVMSMFSGGLTMLALSQAESLFWLIAFAGLTGVAAEFHKPASSALLADLTRSEDRVTAYAAYRFAINAGWAIGPATAGLLAKYSYLWLFVGDAATSFAYGAIAWFMLPEPRKDSRAQWKKALGAFASVADACRCALKDRRYVRFLIGAFGPAIVLMQMPSSLGLEINFSGFSETVYGGILALNGVLIIAFELPLCAFTRRLTPTTAIAVGYALLGGGFAIFAYGDSIATYALGMTVFTFGEMFSMPIAMAYAAELSPAHMRGRYMGVYSLVWGLALTIGPAAGMAIFEFDPFLLWTSCGALGLIAAVITLDLFHQSDSVEAASGEAIEMSPVEAEG